MAQRKNCLCYEAFINGTRDIISPHDCDYVDARNKLQAEAEKRANATCDSSGLTAKWTREFHRAMNQLAYETGLTKSPPRPEGMEFIVPVKLCLLRLNKFAD